jgi:hypothetical protein
MLGDEARARSDLREVSRSLESAAVAAANTNPRAALYAAGDADSILPYARSLAANGRVCAQWRGRFTVSAGRRLVAACRRLLIGPPSQRS